MREWERQKELERKRARAGPSKAKTGTQPVLIDDLNTSHYTPLMAACMPGSTELAEFLLKKGACPDATDGIGRNALSFANDCSEIIELLKKYGGPSPFHSFFHNPLRHGVLFVVTNILVYFTDPLPLQKKIIPSPLPPQSSPPFRHKYAGQR